MHYKVGKLDQTEPQQQGMKHAVMCKARLVSTDIDGLIDAKLGWEVLCQCRQCKLKPTIGIK
jgi:hypothetical protein